MTGLFTHLRPYNTPIQTHRELLLLLLHLWYTVEVTFVPYQVDSHVSKAKPPQAAFDFFLPSEAPCRWTGRPGGGGDTEVDSWYGRQSPTRPVVSLRLSNGAKATAPFRLFSWSFIYVYVLALSAEASSLVAAQRGVNGTAMGCSEKERGRQGGRLSVDYPEPHVFVVFFFSFWRCGC